MGLMSAAQCSRDGSGPWSQREATLWAPSRQPQGPPFPPSQPAAGESARSRGNCGLDVSSCFKGRPPPTASQSGGGGGLPATCLLRPWAWRHWRVRSGPERPLGCDLRSPGQVGVLCEPRNHAKPTSPATLPPRGGPPLPLRNAIKPDVHRVAWTRVPGRRGRRQRAWAGCRRPSDCPPRPGSPIASPPVRGAHWA